MRAFFLFLAMNLLLAVNMAQAEYRVFNLVITNTKTNTSRTVTSTLDPHQYPLYNPVEPGEVVSYIQTWRCFGRTGDFQEFCPDPKAQSPAQPANP